MTNLKKTTAMLTAMLCMTAAVPAMEQPVSALGGDPYLIVSIDYAEGTDEAETYLVTDNAEWLFAITAEEMEQYLTDFSAELQVGDAVNVFVDRAHIGSDAEPGSFVFTEKSYLTYAGKAEEVFSVTRSYVLLREYEDMGYFLMQDVESGDKVTYQRQHYVNHPTPYHMDDAVIGDTVSFYIGEYDQPMLPFSVQKGDGTISELPEAVIHESYRTSPAIVIGANYGYGSDHPGVYLVSMGHSEFTLGNSTFFAYMNEFDYPECGDVLMIDYTSILETYPGQLRIPQNGVITNVGKAEDLYGTKSYTVTDNTGYQLDLKDADGNSKRWFYSITEEMGYVLYHYDASQAQIGDTVTFVLNENGDPVLPVTDTEYPTPTEEFAVVAVDDAENPQNFILYSLDGQENSIRLTADVLADCLAEGEEMPQFGDLLELTGYIMRYDNGLRLTDNFKLQAAGENLGSDVNDGVIRNVGSVFDNCEKREMKFTEIGGFNYYYSNISFTDGGNILYPSDFLKNHVQPGCVDLSKLYYGDMVTMVLYNDIPVFPADSAVVLGDVNGDNGLDILDVIRINKYILSGEPLPALSGARTGDPGQCDFNGNGTIDADDSLGMMKRILHLE